MPSVGKEHVRALTEALGRFDDAVTTADRWGRALAESLPSGARLLAVGNGGSAAQAQHLTSELVGRYSPDRPAFSALSLNTETSALTAILNDYGPDEVFARQVAAHGRPGDVLVALSTSGSSSNAVAAARRARELGLTTWALTGPAPNPLALACDDVLAVEADETAVVQELHLLAVHLICASFDEELLSPVRSVPAWRSRP